jgi:Leucine-rich repeat (LRR) protein
LVQLPAAWLAGLTRLHTLEIFSANNLQEIPETIGAAQHLTCLMIAGASITGLPQSIGQLSMLQILTLELPLVTHLPSTIGGLRSLQTMVIYDTPLEDVPAGIGGLTSLRYLSFPPGMSIHALPDSFSRLQALEQLRIPCPHARSLCDSLTNLSRLTSLDVAACDDVTHIPGVLQAATNLREMTISYSNMGSSPVDAAGDLTSLTMLTIYDDCYTDDVPILAIPEAILRATNLQHLYIECTQLALTPELTRLKALTELILAADALTGDLDLPPLRCLPRYVWGRLFFVTMEACVSLMHKSVVWNC